MEHKQKHFDINELEQTLTYIIEKNHKIITVAGSSASGKSFFAKQIADGLKKKGKNVLEISSDDYYMNDTGLKFMLYGTFDHPNLIEYDLLAKNLEELKTQGSTFLPRYSFKERRRTETYKVKGEYDYIIVEGLYTLSQLPNSLNALKFFVDSDTEELIFRRVVRDQERVAEPMYMILEMIGKVFPMRNIYGMPQKNHADVLINNNYEILEKNAEISKYEIFSQPLETLGTLQKTSYMTDFEYNDSADHNGSIILSEIYKDPTWLLDWVILTKVKKHKIDDDILTKSISVTIYQPGVLTQLHSLLQNAGLKLRKITKKSESIYVNHTTHTIIEEENGNTYIKIPKEIKPETK